MVGCDVLVHTRDGGEIAGVFNTATPFDTPQGTDVVLKMCRVKGGRKVIENGSTVVISIDDVTAIEVGKLDLRSSKGACLYFEFS